MLIEIESAAFKEKGNPRGKILFHKGLNTIVAAETTNNSTGKTSFLLAIDFAFGGKSYAEEEAKIVENVGHHTLKFAFDFGGEKLYFSRSTASLNTVTVCNSDYSKINDISLNDFCKLLAHKYGFEDSSLTFRGAVSPYFRISHKSSKNLSEFLIGGSDQKNRDAVINFEKLFDRFKEILTEKEKCGRCKKS